MQRAGPRERGGDDLLIGGLKSHLGTFFNSLDGGDGTDDLDGGPGTDTLNGGEDSDECTRGEIYESCEVIP